MGDKDDYLTSYRVFFENFAATVDPEDQLPVNIAGYTITEAELPGEVIYWTTQYLTEKQCPLTLMTPLQRIILDEVRIASKKHPNEFGYNSDESEYVALRLMQAVTARVNDVCLRYLDNSRLDSLPPPPPMTLREYRSTSSATKNSRRSMEDRHVEIGNLEALFGIETTEPTSFYAVYDGHAGSAAATYCAAHLHQYLVESRHFTSDLPRALQDAFLRTDAEFIRKSNQKRVSGGSTAVCVALRARRLVAAWAGDSLALLAKRMRLMQLVRAHKPHRPDELKRIEATGGQVMHYGTWRVNGQLAVSRAIGDAQYKPYVTACPETAVVELDGDEDFVVVACDGLWDEVSEDAVALYVYKQLAKDPDDLKAVPKNLVRLAKSAGSQDNITVIVVFLKDPRDIVADNSCPPMDLGLDNAVVNAPPFAVENEACKMVAEGGGDADDNVSDSDSDDLGPETAVDADLDGDEDMPGRDPAPPTPPAHAVERSHVDGNLVDNVAESGEESEDEWNYYKGEGEREQNPSEEADEPPRSETPCQDNSAWENSSVDMNSSPLNPDAPVFVPGSVAGSDMLLAESPRKPLPMDDIELPDVAQFRTEAVVRPAELQDLDNCDQLNGHHNISMEGVTEHLNGNDKSEMESLGFGFSVGIEQDKIKDTSLIQDFERIQKDTTDFCNIQVFQSHTETNPFSSDGNDELFERLKNKERDPMSMSFYQEKDDDTCERFGKMEPHVDLNAVQPLPDSDDEDFQPNGICQNVTENDKENLSPDQRSNLLGLDDEEQEPNNDIMRFDERTDAVSNNISNLDNFMDFSVHNTNNMQNYSNTEYECNVQADTVVQTDTPESHKLLFEQIPEIPDGKSSELGFTNEDTLDPSESERDTRVITPQEEVSQDVEMESKFDESPSEEVQPEIPTEPNELVLDHQDHSEKSDLDAMEQLEKNENEIVAESEFVCNEHEIAQTPEATEEQEQIETARSEMTQENVVVDVHRNSEPPVTDLVTDEFEQKHDSDELISNEVTDNAMDAPQIKLEAPENISEPHDDKSPMPSNAQSPIPSESLLPSESPILTESPLPSESPVPAEPTLLSESLVPTESPLPSESPLPATSPAPAELEKTASSLAISPVPSETEARESPLLAARSPVPSETEARESPLPTESPIPSTIEAQSPEPSRDIEPAEVPLPRESPLPAESPLLEERIESPVEVNEASNVEEEPAASPLPENDKLSEHFTAESQFKSQFSDTEMEEPPEEKRIESPLPVESIEPTSDVIQDSQFPVQEEQEKSRETLAEEHREPSPLRESIESPAHLETLRPSESPLPVASESPVPVDIVHSESAPTESHPSRDSPLPVESFTTETLPVESDKPRSPSPAPVETTVESPAPEEPVAAPADTRLSPEVPREPEPAPERATDACPAPDLVPEERPRTELVTDIDIGIAESRAQEICVPVTNEIQQEDSVRPGATPPPTPAVEPASPALDAPIAAATAAVAATAAAAAAATAVVAKAKTASPKKSPSTPKPDAKTPKAAPKSTPASAAKRPASAAAAPKSPATSARTTSARTPASAAKASPAARPAAKPAAAPAKPAPKPASASAVPRAPAAARTTTAPRPITKTTAPKTTAAPPKPAAPAPVKATVPAPAKPAPRLAARPAPAARVPSAATAKPKAPSAATKPVGATAKAPGAATKTLSATAKPLANGDVKGAAKPAPKVPAAPRAAPRPAARPAAPASAATKSAAPKPATRAPLDKQSKDLANKRITAKAAPPRTAAAKAPTGIKSVPKPKKIENGKNPASEKGLANGAGEPPLKAPPSPPADSALLPDVIA